MQPDEYKPLPPQAHAFLDGRLNAEEEADFRRRMDNEPELSAGVEQLRSTLALLKTLPAREPAPGFNERVLGRVREVDLVERARKRITGARSPLWQHVAQVAAGAVAASIALALVGSFGPWSKPAPLGPAGPGVDVAKAGASEDDILLNLSDQYDRYRHLAAHFDALGDVSPDAQRRLVRIDLEASGLLRRGQWLEDQIDGLPTERQREYRVFLQGLRAALQAADLEVAESAAESRPMDLARVNRSLGAVKAPTRLARDLSLSVPRGAVSAATGVSIVDKANPEMEAYGNVRVLVYSHDHQRVVGACNEYAKAFTRGNYLKQAGIEAIHALVRLGQIEDAARRWDDVFGKYDDRSSPADLRMVNLLLTPAEVDSINTQRQALHRDE